MKLKKTSALALVCALLLVCGVTTVFATSAAEPAPETAPVSETTPLDQLEKSIVYMDGKLSFTIPESGADWSIWIGGRIQADGMGMSVHYLEAESAAGSWEGEKTYQFQVAEGPYESLTLFAAVDGEERDIDLTAYLPESGETAPAAEGVWLQWPMQDDDPHTVGEAFGGRWQPGGEEQVLHEGIDLPAEQGSVILAAAGGTVAEVGFSAYDGNYLVLDHGNGLETFYAHCRDFTVQEGDTVNAGGMIGAVGSTGMSTGPHLHFEVRQDGEAQDPLGYFSEETLAQISFLW